MTLDNEIELLRSRLGIDRINVMLDAICVQIDLSHKFEDRITAEIKEINRRLGSIEQDIKYLGDRVHPVFYKVFPEMIEVENKLDDIVRDAGKSKPKG